MRDSAVRACLNSLETKVDGDVRTDDYSRLFYSTDASIYQVQPHAVVIPKSREDVQAVVEEAHRFGVPVLARAAGSSLAGQAVNEAIVIVFTTHLDSILDINLEAKTVRVEPGVVLGSLNQRLAADGIQFGPDPASANRAAMGGIVSNNSTGAHSILYGMTADHVRHMNVIFADGSRGMLGPGSMSATPALGSTQASIESAVRDLLSRKENAQIIRENTPRHWRRCGGYNLDRLVADVAAYRMPQADDFNLARLICGAEGTLAVIEDVTLDLVPLPDVTGIAVVHFDSLPVALSAVAMILETDPSAVELLDRLGMSLCRESPVWRRKLESFVGGVPECVLITEYYGASQGEVEAKIDVLKALLTSSKAGSGHVVTVLEPAAQEVVWQVRKMGLGFLMSMKGDHKPIPFIEDAAVPKEHLSHYVTEVERFCKGLGVQVAYYAHASAGCVHIRPLINTKSAKEVSLLPEITSFAIELLKGNGGSLSSEHGDGRARSSFNKSFYGDDLYGLYQDVKTIFDPGNLLNPGNIVNAGPMTEHLRYGDGYTSSIPELHLDFSEDQGFDRAVEMCNGAGVCRKLSGGVMCPSFQATREEEHSTRGRANALRAAISGAVEGGLASKRLHETMDLCLECKACVSECPSSVDMTRLKVEALAQYHDVHGIPMRSRVFGLIAEQNRLWSGAVAPVLNKIVHTRAFRWLGEHVIGISRHRRLPDVAEQSFVDWFETRAPVATADRTTVVLFNDTFNTYNYPQTSIAATQFLEAAGFNVVLPGHRCCGRPMISKGLVEQARAYASQTIERLNPYAAQGIKIIGLEPSCLLTLKDEYKSLLPGDPRVAVVAEMATLFEEFVVAESEAGRLRVLFEKSDHGIMLHGHCHQKALAGTESSMTALRLTTDFPVKEIDSGCCGMAGSFGYEKEHYDLSQQIGEQRLFPAVRQAGPEYDIAATGVSCREQIVHGTGRTARHPAEILWEAVDKKSITHSTD
jgi:FAD/FMN-containing dehydrogenase/Fe-S oxidoreductase